MSVSNDQIYALLVDLKGDVGGIKAGLAANESHTAHVSRKVDNVRAELDAEDRRIEGKVDAHVKENGAHGVAAEQRGRSSVFAAIAVAGSIFGAIAGGVTVAKILAPAVQAQEVKR